MIYEVRMEHDCDRSSSHSILRTCRLKPGSIPECEQRFAEAPPHCVSQERRHYD